jgi:arylsulfatase A
MIESSDAELGKLLQLLEENGRLDNTLIIVASDNGASTTTSSLTNAPYRGAKGTLFEGGTLSPLVARWPAGNIKVHGMTDQMSTYLDLMPTFLHVAGITYPERWHDGMPLSPLEGRNLLPLFRGEKLSPPEDFYWSLYGYYAVLHNGRWKLLANSTYNQEKERSQAEPVLALYDLLSDPAETENLAGKKKDMVTLLLANYHIWAKQHGAMPYYQVLDEYKKHRAVTGQSMQD